MHSQRENMVSLLCVSPEILVLRAAHAIGFTFRYKCQVTAKFSARSRHAWRTYLSLHDNNASECVYDMWAYATYLHVVVHACMRREKSPFPHTRV